jgi:hypothetical protein
MILNIFWRWGKSTGQRGCRQVSTQPRNVCRRVGKPHWLSAFEETHMHNILTVNLLFGTLVFWIAARIYVLPRLHECEPRTVLLPILLLHALRHLGLMFLAPSAHDAALAPEFAYPSALGDLVAALLALIAIPAVAARARIAKPLVWLFNVWGTLDLLAAIVLANFYDASTHMGAAYWIPAFWVPGLLVTHYIAFIVLLQPWSGAANEPPPARARQ